MERAMVLCAPSNPWRLAIWKVAVTAIVIAAGTAGDLAAETSFRCDGSTTNTITFSYQKNTERLTGQMKAGDTITFTFGSSKATSITLVAQTSHSICNSTATCVGSVSYTAPVAGTYNFDATVTGLFYFTPRFTAPRIGSSGALVYPRSTMVPIGLI